VVLSFFKGNYKDEAYNDALLRIASKNVGEVALAAETMANVCQSRHVGVKICALANAAEEHLFTEGRKCSICGQYIERDDVYLNIKEPDKFDSPQVFSAKIDAVCPAHTDDSSIPAIALLYVIELLKRPDAV
jgi:hypothetical protein